LNAISHVSPEADHETNKGVPKAFAEGLNLPDPSTGVVQVWLFLAIRHSRTELSYIFYKSITVFFVFVHHISRVRLKKSFYTQYWHT
jgi:hypothetical protein